MAHYWVNSIYVGVCVLSYINFIHLCINAHVWMYLDLNVLEGEWDKFLS